jgi:hypothetical protein
MIYIEDVEPHFWTTTGSLGEILLSLLSWLFLALGVRRYTWKDYLWHTYGVFYHWKVLQLGFDLALH